MAALLERLRVREGHPDAQLAIRVGVGALVAEVRNVALTAALEGLREREGGRGVIGRAARPRIDDRLRDPVGDADERDDVARVVDHHGLDEPRVAEREPAEVALGDERTGDVILPDDIEHRVLELP